MVRDNHKFKISNLWIPFDLIQNFNINLFLTLSANEASSSSKSDLEGRKFSDKQNFLTGDTEKWDQIRTTEMEDLAKGAEAWFS